MGRVVSATLAVLPRRRTGRKTRSKYVRLRLIFCACGCQRRQAEPDLLAAGPKPTYLC